MIDSRVLVLLTGYNSRRRTLRILMLVTYYKIKYVF